MTDSVRQFLSPTTTVCSHLPVTLHTRTMPLLPCSAVASLLTATIFRPSGLKAADFTYSAFKPPITPELVR